jgi:hypothetical protein
MLEDGMHSTEDKRWWVDTWRREEDAFVEHVCPMLGLQGTINPEKDTNPYAPDLVVEGRLADLKCQRTPFFKASSLFGIDLQFAVTFNRKDFVRYTTQYPDLVIYFWVDWHQLSMVIGGASYAVEPMSGIWRVKFEALAQAINERAVQLHEYQRRRNDNSGNARDSYVFDLRKFECLRRNIAL